MIRVCKEESFHQRQGFQILWNLFARHRAQRAMAQDATNRLGWPARDVGPAGEREAAGLGQTAQSMAWGIKWFSTNDLRRSLST